jgi:hypothetical protein
MEMDKGTGERRKGKWGKEKGKGKGKEKGKGGWERESVRRKEKGEKIKRKKTIAIFQK